MSFTLQVLSLERTLFQGQVQRILAPGADGVLGILPGHMPLLSALKEGELHLTTDDGEDQSFAIWGGFLRVLPDQVVVLADAAEHPDEIDVAGAQEARRLAESHLAAARAGGGQNLQEALRAVRRSAIRIRVAERRHRDRYGGLENQDRRSVPPTR